MNLKSFTLREFIEECTDDFDVNNRRDLRLAARFLRCIGDVKPIWRERRWITAKLWGPK